MPELPETRSIAKFMDADLRGKMIVRSSAIPGLVSEHLPLKVEKVWARMKRVIITCSTQKGEQLHVFCFLAITGQWRKNQEGKHTKHFLQFGEVIYNNFSTMIIMNDIYYFDDIGFRAKATLELMTTTQLQNKLTQSNMDISDMSVEQIKLHLLKQTENKKNKPICEVMLDAKTFVGVGNIYRAEILFYAGIHPQRSINQLSEVELKKLAECTISVLNYAESQKGCSFSDYILPDLTEGNYKNLIYGRTEYNGYAVEKYKSAGDRTMYWCPHYQK